MNPCNSCATNSWTFDKKDGWITAICKSCKSEVRFQAREGSSRAPTDKPAVIHTLGEKCPKCQIGNLAEGTHKPGWVPKDGQRYFFSRWLYCDRCRESYFDDKNKVEL